MRIVHVKHGEVQAQIESLHEHTRDMLWRQQQDLTRSFRAQIQDMHEALSLERDRNDKGSASWVMKCEKYKKELDWLRSLTDKLTTENKIFIRENRRFQQQLNTNEQDKAFLMKQLVIAKKENARLRLMLERAAIEVPPALPSETAGALTDSGSSSPRDLLNQNIARHPLAVTPITSVIQRPATSRVSSSRGGDRGQSASEPKTSRRSTGDGSNLEQSGAESTTGALHEQLEAAYAQIAMLRKELKKMETKCRAAETKLADELASRSQLLELVKVGVEELRQEILTRRAEHARLLAKRAGVPAARLSSTLTAAALSGPGVGSGSSPFSATAPILKKDPREVGLDQFTPADKARLVEWLISQDIVVYALYELLFPVSDRGSGLGIEGITGGSLGLGNITGGATSRVKRAVDNAIALAQAHAQSQSVLSQSQPQSSLQTQPSNLTGVQRKTTQSMAHRPATSASVPDSTTSQTLASAISTTSSGTGSNAAATTVRRLRPSSSTKPKLYSDQSTTSPWDFQQE